MLPYLLGLLGLLLTLYYSFLAPPQQPYGVPAVPFWVSLLPLIKDVDQEEVFLHYIAPLLREKGAVKVFFAGQWNVLVQRPSLVAEIFKREDIYHKSGNQKKIPHSVLAEFLDLSYTGSNIISAHGEEWRRYRGVVQPGLLPNAFAVEPLVEHTQQLCEWLLHLQSAQGSHGVVVQEVLQRYSSANLLHCVLGQPDVARTMMGDQPAPPLYELQLTLKQYLFRPLFMSFPVLDQLSALIPSRIRARQLVRSFAAALQSTILRDRADHQHQLDGNLGSRLAQAWREENLSDKEFRDNLMVLYVAGQENPQLLMISTLYLLAQHPDVQSRLRDEIRSSGLTTISATHQDWTRLPYLTAIILESLRLFPPISQLINRRVAQTTQLGHEIELPEGMYVGYHSYATNRDEEAWGSSAHEFQPTRWGTTDQEIMRTYRRAKARANFISFHGGARACLGEKFAMLQMRILLVGLLDKLIWRLDESWVPRMVPAGPLHPRGLRLVFSRYNQE
ncbi:cytochrome P450 [Aspergillus fijiensis CBS 313.89]|uniref:Putative cytochrome P450 oxidoreductase n=1 Tax=Aspergillus fijiensis CBS 313.89 TaxID=1448319 RepID=A0A8G1S0J3_9EURO|nr:putative cytochrome P450 oxidoreductase [Aspergillus fijiensis CBS 313.89]RAK81743.1 putative cytochrome P450 oxidoreductase [Aspergillus fijiensis CBS 313.89]